MTETRATKHERKPGRNPDGDVRAADRQVETAVPEESHIEYLVKVSKSE